MIGIYYGQLKVSSFYPPHACWSSAHASGGQNDLACQPSCIVRGQEHGYVCDIVRAAGSTQRRLAYSPLLKIGPNNILRSVTFGVDDPRVNGVNPDTFRAQFASQDTCDAVDRCFASDINGGIRWCQSARTGTYVNDASALFQLLDRGLRHKEKSEH